MLRTPVSLRGILLPVTVCFSFSAVHFVVSPSLAHPAKSAPPIDVIAISNTIDFKINASKEVVIGF